MQPAFIVIDEDACGNIHGIYQYQSLLDGAFLDSLLYEMRYVHQSSA